MSVRLNALVALAVVTWVSAAQASPITVPNGSFEAPASTGAQGTVPTDWTYGGDGTFSGTGTATSSPISGEPEDGSQFFAMNTYPGTWGSQSMTTAASLGTYAADTVYTLTVAAATNDGTGYVAGTNGTVGIDLLAGASVEASTTEEESLLPLNGTTAGNNWTDLIVILNTTTDPGVVGQPINVQITGNSDNPSGSWGNAYLDNVRLDATSPVPEPAAISLALMGLSAPMLRRRHRVA
jgi:hypothetical protein